LVVQEVWDHLLTPLDVLVVTLYSMDKPHMVVAVVVLMAVSLRMVSLADQVVVALVAVPVELDVLAKVFLVDVVLILLIVKVLVEVVLINKVVTGTQQWDLKLVVPLVLSCGVYPLLFVDHVQTGQFPLVEVAAATVSSVWLEIQVADIMVEVVHHILVLVQTNNPALVVPFLSDIRSYNNHLKKCHKTSPEPLGRFYSIWSYSNHMGLTGTEKLIFISSFFLLMNWGVRVTERVLWSIQ
jgi:hypothetical protein